MYDPTRAYGKALPLVTTNGWRRSFIRFVIANSAARVLPKGTYYNVVLSPPRLPTLDNPFPRIVAWYSYPNIPHRTIKWKGKPRYMADKGYYLVARLRV